MDTTKTFNHISLCAGYGGIDIGLGRVIRNLRTIAFSEIEAFVCANLVAKMEAGLLDTAPVWTNLKTFPFREFRGKVGILSGGFPCQPFSAAGKRGGDEDPRHLFPHILKGITECQPNLVFLENVEGIISAKLAGTDWRDPAGTPVLLHVLRELERVGYRATAGVFSSAEIGASHQRKRVFILGRKMADPMHDGCDDAKGSGGVGSGADEGWLLQSEGIRSPQRNVCLRPKTPGPDQWWWEPARVVQSKSRSRSAVADAEGGVSGESSESQWRESAGGGSQAVGDPTLVQCDGGDNHARVSLESGSVSESGDASRTNDVANNSGFGRGEGRTESGGKQGRPDVTERGESTVGNATGEYGSGQGQGQGHGQVPVGRTGSKQGDGSTFPPLDRDSHGSPDWMDYAELQKSMDSRVDELRAIGNGVDPDVAAKAFVTLYNRLTS